MVSLPCMTRSYETHELDRPYYSNVHVEGLVPLPCMMTESYRSNELDGPRYGNFHVKGLVPLPCVTKELREQWMDEPKYANSLLLAPGKCILPPPCVTKRLPYVNLLPNGLVLLVGQVIWLQCVCKIWCKCTAPFCLIKIQYLHKVKGITSRCRLLGWTCFWQFQHASDEPQALKLNLVLLLDNGWWISFHWRNLFWIKKNIPFVRPAYIFDFWPPMGCINPLNYMLWVTFQIEIKSETKQRLQEDDWLLTMSFHVAYRKLFHDKIHLSTLRCCLNDHFLLLHRTKHTCVTFCTGMTCTGIFSPSVVKGWCYVNVVNFVVLRLTKTRRKKQHPS